MKQQLRTLAEEYEIAYFERFPEMGLFWGKEGVPLDRFTDNHISAFKDWETQEDSFIERLNQIDESQLTGTPEHTTYQLLKQRLTANHACRICKDELWDLDPLFGWHIRLGLIAEKQPLGSQELRKAALSRFGSVPRIVENEIDNLQAGIKQGYTAPKPVVERIIHQLELMQNYSKDEHPLMVLAERDPDSQFKNQVATLIEETIQPALNKYLGFLKDSYLPKARTSVGLVALPNGQQCYLAKIERETTLQISPDEIFNFGKQYMSQLEAEIKIVGQKVFGLTELSEIFKTAKTDPQYLFSSEKEMLSYNLAALDRVKSKVGQWFNQMPNAKGELKPYPLHRAKTGAPGEYHPPSEDGSRPGIFYINTFEPEKRSRVDHEATLFHELIPGHHYQVALTQEDKTHLSLDKFLWNSGYGEGWALYSERLADEMELYTDDVSKIGMLSNEALRAARLIVDPGLHYFGWTRQQAVDFLSQHTAMEPNIIQSEVDRYIMLPGQATSYMLGQREIMSLRSHAEQHLKGKFDIKEFHHQVLKDGAVSLPMLRDNILAWVEKSSENTA